MCIRDSYVTPETEPEALVGQHEPDEEKLVIWKDGAVTEAFENGYWLIIENISEAQSTVLERLNSVLEIPPEWTVTENPNDKENEKEEKKDKWKNFRVFATMTPPGKSSERLSGANVTTNSELSPALYNRFNIIHMENTLNSEISICLLYTSPSPRDATLSRMPSSA